MRHFSFLFRASYLRFLPGHPTILFSSLIKTRPSAAQASPAPVSTPSPARCFPPGFMWRRSRTSWSARSCVMNGNPLSERSELWIFVNDLSSFRQALEFRSAATESPEGACARGVHENQTILFPASGLNLLLSYSSTLLIGTLTNLLYSFFPCKVLIYPQI